MSAPYNASVRKFIAHRWLSVVLLAPCALSFGADAGPLVITVPQGFEGPTRTDANGGTTIAWVKRRPGSDGGTLLQASSIDVGPSLDGITPDQRVEASAHYLVEFAKGLAQRLEDFELGDIERTSLAGLPAVRARWTGSLGGRASIGVMYCVLVGRTVVSLQTQDVGSGITPSMYSAIGAIEGVRVR